MDATELRSRIKNYIDHADERLLKIFNAIIEAENYSAGHAQADRISRPAHHRNTNDDEKSQEEGMGSLKDDHRLK